MQRTLTRFTGLIISFLLPFFILGGVLVLRRIYPFGNQSLLMADQYTQYIQFYNHFYDVIKGGNGSLLYTWEEGMGLNFWGTFAYYLSSPISIVVLFFQKSHLPEAFVIMTLIKIGLAGLMMNVYLSKLFKTNKLTILIFSTLYSLVSYSIGYFFNIMWLDSVYMLPLVLLGIEFLLRKRALLLIISLSILFVSNFYMAYIVGLFAFLYYLLRIFSTPTTIKEFIKSFLLFMLSTIIAGGISAFITLPTFLLLKSNGSPSVTWGDMLNFGFGFFDLLPKFYNGSGHLFDLPDVYCGLLAMLLFPIYFMNNKIKSREKVIYFILSFILLLSMQINGLNLVWHAFSPPTGYYQRFAFVVSFILILLSFKSYLTFDKENISALFKVYLANVFILMLLTKLSPDMMSVNKALLNIIILTVFGLLLYGKAVSANLKSLFQVLLLIVACMDLGLNAYLHLRTINSYTGYSFTRDQYNIQNQSFEKIVNQLKNADKGFYRTNSLVRLTPNDSIRYGYKGMTNFNTLSNGVLHQFMNNIGYSTTLGSRSLAQNQGILTSDALFGFKYLITQEPLSKYGYKMEKCENGICLYKNEFSLPIGFMVNQKQFEFNTNDDNPFENQNQLLGPVNQNNSYFQQIRALSISYKNLTVTNQGNIQYIKKIDPQQEGSIEMVLNVKNKQQLYTSLSAGKGFAGYNETTISVNGKSLGVYPTYHNDRVLDLGAFSNEKVTVKIVFSVPDTQLTQQLFYGLDISSFNQRIGVLNKEPLHVKSWTETTVKGNINVSHSGSLFLSIPYDKGWKISVDGKNEQIKKLGGFIGVNLDKGEHTIALSYLPEGFKTGCAISIGSLLLLLIYIVVILKRKQTKEN
ncbi:YfhO family protein [Neobacillus sp. PS3-12]|uniref:YfhO family protein n=1 Tax=Neobacillus sp. PS3-12 TaxID=3070677 RepID=UPI0027DFCD5E|nr:YfhO family protein [Neobacillus sp. PS3-12]WML54778.1 YfhO family protein [Neobacillus sp. PS3-12]